MMVLFYFVLILRISAFTQNKYNTVDDIYIAGASIVDLESIIKETSARKTRTYTPPPGDNEEYDRIEYYENDDISLTVYKGRQGKFLSSAIVKTAKYKLTLNKNQYSVCDSISKLSLFPNSFETFRRELSERDGKEVDFHLTTKFSNNEEGTISFAISNGFVERISISLNPA